MRRRPKHPRPYWVAVCPANPDQGQVEAWITERGRPILICDVCYGTWFGPPPAAGTEIYPDDASGMYDDGDSMAPDVARPATRRELERLGWWDLVTPLSRAFHDDDDG
jgi:hypothetical protein